jgi:hypothetical protein
VATPDGKIYAIGGTDVGAYGKSRNEINFFLPEKLKLYTGKVQNTVEVLDIYSDPPNPDNVMDAESGREQ